MNSVKVYKMNDYEWWASKLCPRETRDIYLEEYDLDKDDNPLEDIRECNIDEEGMWWRTTDENDLKAIGDLHEIVNYENVMGNAERKPKFGNLSRIDGEIFIYIPFRNAIQRHRADAGSYEGPYMIASTEY